MASIFSKPNIPAPIVPKSSDAALKEEQRRRRLAGATGRQQTILTPLQGSFDNKKTLLGQ